MINNTVTTYQNGLSQEAYQMFLSDPSSNDDVPFATFCDEMDKIIDNRKELKSSGNGHSVNFI